MVFAGMLMALLRVATTVEGELAFHYGSFDNVYGDGDVATAADNGHIYDDTPTGTYTWGTLGSASTASNQTTYTWTPPQPITADVLLVAGGGAGGTDRGGGGGAGGLVFLQNESISGQKTIVVGNGGASGTTSEQNGDDGKDTTFLSYICKGGGGGGSQLVPEDSSGRSGGSGGGVGGRGLNSFVGTSSGIGGSSTQNTYSGKGFGNKGGDLVTVSNEAWGRGGGGGGAGAAGQDMSQYDAGDGGIGKDYSSTFGTTYGDSGYFAGGGGGGIDIRNSGNVGAGGQGGGGSGGDYGASGGVIGSIYPVSGTSHTGGGGGGGGVDPIRTSDYGAAGGSGIVLVKFPSS